MIPSDLAPRILVGHVLEQLRMLPSESVQCVVTSPPYWGLRAYGTEPQIWGGEVGHDHSWSGPAPRRSRSEGDVQTPDSTVGGASCACGAWLGELGNEPTPELFVSHLADVFDEVRRVLRQDGTLWLNLGDSYNGSGKGPTGRNGIQKAERRQNFVDQKSEAAGLKPKDLVGIPWRVAFELQKRGWWLRSDCIWAKPNPMPESVRDRPTRCHEYVFLLTKSERYFYDADSVRTSYSEATVRRLAQAGFDKQTGGPKDYGPCSNRSARRALVNLKGLMMAPQIEDAPGRYSHLGANLRSVWWIPTRPYPEAHFATYPETLPEICIKASTRVDDLVLDPFCGSGTTLWVARQLGRRVVGIELNPEYAALARRRCLAAVPDIETISSYAEARA